MMCLVGDKAESESDATTSNQLPGKRWETFLTFLTAKSTKLENFSFHVFISQSSRTA